MIKGENRVGPVMVMVRGKRKEGDKKREKGKGVWGVRLDEEEKEAVRRKLAEVELREDGVQEEWVKMKHKIKKARGSKRGGERRQEKGRGM